MKTMLPIVNNQVRPWFEQYGNAITDKVSVKNMIKLAVDDVASLEKLMPQYRRYIPNEAMEFDVEIADAKALIAAMLIRLDQLENRTRRKRSNDG